MNYADIKYSKELKDWFSESEWWVSYSYPLHFDDKYKYGFNLDKEMGVTDFHVRETEDLTHLHSLPTVKNVISYPVLTTDMLLERLPTNIACKRMKDDYSVWRMGNLKPSIKFHDKTLPNALAKMMLWLIKEGLMK